MFSAFFFFSFFFFTYYVFGGEGECHDIHVQVRGQLVGFDFLLSL